MTDQKKKQVHFADCYVLTKKRNKHFISSFLDQFLPNRKELAETYEIPQFSDDPTVIFHSAAKLIDYLEENKNEVHAIYWSNKEEAQLRGAMCLFTSDGQIILGVYCETLHPDTTIENKYLKDLMDFCESTNGLILYEEPAPQDTPEFLQKIKANTGER